MLQKFCHYLLFRLLGWRLEGEVPSVDKYLFVVVPHTSNWDFFYGWLAITALGLNVKIFVKDTFFVWPLNYLCNFFGLSPVNRRRSTNFVDAVANMFRSTPKLAALITPEGTRSYQPGLKSGYYHIAVKANIPIVVAGPNFGKKTITLNPPRQPLPTFDEDQAHVIAFAKTQIACRPENTFK